MKIKIRKGSKSAVPRSLKRKFPELESISDSDEKIEVSVTDKDCEVATKKDSNNCALAKATKRQFQADAVVIGMSSSYVIKDNKAIRFQTPEAVCREIISFDRHGDFEPGEYKLVPKSGSNRLGNYKYEKHDRRPKKQPRIYHKTARIRVF